MIKLEPTKKCFMKLIRTSNFIISVEETVKYQKRPSGHEFLRFGKELKGDQKVLF